METLGEALPKEIERVQEIIKLYESIPNGHFAASLMRADIQNAQQAMMEGNLPLMLAIYQDLKEWKE